MKKLIMILVSGVVYTSLITGYATAQKATNAAFAAPPVANTAAASEDEKSAVDPTDKAAVNEMKARLKAAKVNLKITNDLEKNFKNISNVQWHSEEKVTVAHFNMGEKSARVVYDKKGNWLFSVITYYKEQLPKDIAAIVKADYGEFDITLVQEISQGSVAGLYKVFLETCSRQVQILIYNNEITVYGDFQKG